jgi:c-di-GMP-binding flagellar brake protein YcgR
MSATSDPMQWRPAAGQIALIEPVGASPGRDCLTGVVVPGERILVDLGASPRPEHNGADVVASFFAPDALYRLSARATEESDGLLVLDVSAVERVQRRTAPRAMVTLPVRLGVGAMPGSAVLVGETVDVSAGGCRVTTERPWPEHSDPVVSIDLPDGEAVVTQARVVTVDLTGGGWEYRLAFPEIDDPDRERLSRLVALGF